MLLKPILLKPIKIKFDTQDLREAGELIYTSNLQLPPLHVGTYFCGCGTREG